MLVKKVKEVFQRLRRAVFRTVERCKRFFALEKDLIILKQEGSADE